MGIVFRQSAKTSIVVFTGSILGAIIIWLSTKYIVDKHQFGFIQNLTNNAVVISQTLLFGLNSTLPVYIHRFNDNDRKRLLITICLAFPAALSVLFIACYYLFRSRIIGHFQLEDSPYISQYFNWLPIYVLLFIYQMLLEQYLGTQMKIAAAAFVREVVLRLLNIILLVLLGFQFIDFHSFVVFTVLIYFVPATVFFFLSLRTEVFGVSFDLKKFSRSEYIEILHFSWYHFLLVMAIVFMSSMDILLLPYYDHSGFKAVAIYRIPVFMVSFLTLPLKALSPPTMPVLAKAFADEDYAKAKNIFTRSSINVLIATIPLGLIICCNLTNVIAIIKNGYSDILPIFLILFISAFINIATGMNDLVLSIAKYYKFNFYLSLILIIILFALIRVLVPHYGIFGAAWSTTIVVSLFNAAKCFFIWKKLDMQPFSKSTLLVLLAAVPALAAGYFLPYLFNAERHVYIHSFIDGTLRSIVIVIVYFLMLLWLKPSEDLVEYLASIKKNKRLF
jgi:O-antigen/teichoic acid export membrane protein